MTTTSEKTSIHPNIEDLPDGINHRHDFTPAHPDEHVTRQQQMRQDAEAAQAAHEAKEREATQQRQQQMG